MKLKTLVSASLVALLLAGCSPISEGQITNKKYQEAYDYPINYCVVYDADMQCTVWGTRWERASEQWIFEIRDAEKTGWAYVTEQIWNERQIGDYYVG